MRSLHAALLLGVWLLSAVPAAAGAGWECDWLAIRAETQAEFANARRFAKLDCAGREAYWAQQNWLMNQWIHAEYHRSLRPQAAALPALAIPPESAPTTAPAQPQ
jgi:hypothetical protein